MLIIDRLDSIKELNRYSKGSDALVIEMEGDQVRIAGIRPELVRCVWISAPSIVQKIKSIEVKSDLDNVYITCFVERDWAQSIIALTLVSIFSLPFFFYAVHRLQRLKEARLIEKATI
jgi:hypothetical protein